MPSLLLDRDGHFHRFERIVSLIPWESYNLVKNFDTSIYFAKHRVASIQSARIGHTNKELGATIVEVTSAVTFARHFRHGQRAALMRLIVRFGRKTIAGPPGAMQVTVGKFAGRIAALDHKTGNDTVETNAVVKAHLDEIDKILYVSWGRVRVELDEHVAKFRRNDGPWIFLFKLQSHGGELISTRRLSAR
jgi:hypothetical protein